VRNAGKGYTRIVLLVVACAALVVPALGQTPAITPGGTVNAADYTRAFAPGGLISIFGSNFATSAQQATQFPLPTALGGVSVQIVSSGELCPEWYVSATQINAQLPYDVPLGQVQVQVRTGGGVSNTDTITVASAAPKIFTINFSGQGPAVATTTAYKVLTAANPANPADTIVLWMNSMGATSGSPVAGQAAPGTAPGSTALTVSGVAVTVNGAPCPVIFAGLSPGSSGLYQVNCQAPFVTVTGTLPVQVTMGAASTQANVTVSYQQLGFYYSVLGSKFVNGQTQNAIAGSTSALAFEQSDSVTWGTTGYQAWSDSTGLTASQYSAVPGLALTLYNGSTIVYDNNGIETGSTGTFYNNAGGGADSQKPGLTDLYSMSNYFPFIFAGYFNLSSATTVTQLTGYFDAAGDISLIFNPANPYVKYRMNIWSNTSGLLPTQTATFAGNIFSSDTTAGSFGYSGTGVYMVSSNPAYLQKPIYRISYTLATPLTLPAGAYWFSHDASVRAAPAATSTSSFQSITLGEFSRLISMGPKNPQTTEFSFFGRQMSFEESFELPGAFTVLPSAVIEHR